MLPGQKELAKKYLNILRRSLRPTNHKITEYNPLIVDGYNVVLRLSIVGEDKDLPAELRIIFDYDTDCYESEPEHTNATEIEDNPTHVSDSLVSAEEE